MIDVAVCAVADWLADPNTGPNAFLERVLRESVDDALTLPRIVRVADTFRDDDAIAGRMHGERPRLIVYAASDTVTEGEANQNTLHASDTVSVAVDLEVDAILDAQSRRVVAYLLEAIVRSVTAFLADTPEGSAARQRRGFHIIQATRRSWGFAAETAGDGVVAAAFVIDLHIRDARAQV